MNGLLNGLSRGKKKLDPKTKSQDEREGQIEQAVWEILSAKDMLLEPKRALVFLAGFRHGALSCDDGQTKSEAIEEFFEKSGKEITLGAKLIFAAAMGWGHDWATENPQKASK